MVYDAYRNFTEVKIPNCPKTDDEKPLAKYTCNSGTNRLKSMEYANGSVQTLTYDRLGRLIAEKWTKSDNTLEAQHVYLSQGRSHTGALG